MMLDRDRLVGFQDSRLVYIIPQSIQQYKRMTGDDLNFFNSTQVGRQINAMGLIAKRYSNGRTLTIKAPVQGKRPNVWAIRKEDFFGNYDEIKKELSEEVF